MMKLLRNLADEGRTIILVTHATTNITLCDRIVFLGRGGNLCYFVPPRESMKFFQLSDFADIYIKLEPKEAVFQEATRFRQSQYQQDYIDNRISTVKQPGNIEPQKVKRSFLQQLLILTQRYFKLVLRDPVNLTLSLLTAPIGIALITLAVRKQAPLAPDLTEFNDSIKAAPLALKVLFVFTCAALWVGFSTSLQEIVKEGAIYMRERLVNLGLFAYLGSKTIILAGLAILQAILMIAVILIGFKDPEPELIHWIGGSSITIFLTLFAAMSLGLMVSAIAKNSTQANTALHILLLPQIIFSGVLFEVDKASKYISWLMISRWSVGAFGTLVDVNKMADKTMELRPPVPPNTEPIPIPFEGSPVYQVDWHNLALNWEILLLHTFIYLTVTFILQKRKDVL
jgi:ABC-type multidrug transport system permease subunit